MVDTKALRRGFVLGWVLWSVVGLPITAGAVTPALTDREVVERLTQLETRLDEGLKGLRSEMAQLREDMNSRFGEQSQQNQQLRADMQEQNRQLRADMNSRFEEQGRLILGLLAVFGTIIAVNIGLIVWDRRTSMRPLEEKVSELADEVTKSGERGQTLVEVLRALGQQNQTVAAVLKRFNLL